MYKMPCSYTPFAGSLIIQKNFPLIYLTYPIPQWKQGAKIIFIIDGPVNFKKCAIKCTMILKYMAQISV